MICIHISQWFPKCFGASPPCICDVGLKTNLGPSAVAAAVIYKAHFRLCAQRGTPRITNRDRHSSQANVWSRYVYIYIYISTYNHIYHIHKEYGKACESRHLFQFGEMHIHIHIQQYSIIFWHVFGIIHIPDMEISPTNVVIMYQELSSKKIRNSGQLLVVDHQIHGALTNKNRESADVSYRSHLPHAKMYMYIYIYMYMYYTYTHNNIYIYIYITYI